MNRFCRGSRTRGFYRRFYDRAEIDGPDIQPEFSRDNARSVQNILDELRLRLCIVLDYFKTARRGLLVGLSSPEYLRPAEYRIERRSKLVRNDGEELVLGPVGSFGLGASCFFISQQGHESILTLDAFGDIVDDGYRPDDLFIFDERGYSRALLHAGEGGTFDAGHGQQETVQSLRDYS